MKNRDSSKFLFVLNTLFMWFIRLPTKLFHREQDSTSVNRDKQNSHSVFCISSTPLFRPGDEEISFQWLVLLHVMLLLRSRRGTSPGRVILVLNFCLYQLFSFLNPFSLHAETVFQSHFTPSLFLLSFIPPFGPLATHTASYQQFTCMTSQ